MIASVATTADLSAQRSTTKSSSVYLQAAKQIKVCVSREENKINKKKSTFIPPRTYKREKTHVCAYFLHFSNCSWLSFFAYLGDWEGISQGLGVRRYNLQGLQGTSTPIP